METCHQGQKIVGTSPVRLVGANPKRTSIFIKNNSANILYIGSDAKDAIASLLPIAAAGTYSTEHNQGEIWLIASADDSDIRYEECSC